MEKKETKSKQEEKEIKLEPLVISTIKIKIIGLTPYLSNKLSDKTKNDMLDKQTGKGVEKNKIRDIKKEVEEKIHKLSGDRVGIPAFAIKKALIESAPALEMYKKDVRGNIFVIPEENNLVPITYKKMVINEAITKDSGISKAPRSTFRPEFRDWTCEFVVRYNSKVITPEQIFNLIKVAGFSNGVGSWTPFREGTYGTFTISN